MAGDWIQVRVLIASDPQVVAMADYLADQRDYMDWLTNPVQRTCKEHATEHVTRSVTVCVTVASLVRVWGVANDRGARNGDDLLLRYANLETLDEIAGVPCIGEAMRYVGWAVEEIDNSAEVVRFPKFMKHNTPADDWKRLSNAERQKRYRERHKESVTRNVTKVTKSNAKGKKRREECIDTNVSIPPLPPEGGDLPFGTDAFKSAWSDWEQHHREKRKPITPTARAKQLAKLKEMGHDRAVRCLQHSTAQGWQGLYEPDAARGVVPSNHRAERREREYPQPERPLPLL